MSELVGIVRSLNALAEIRLVEQGNVPVDWVLDINAYTASSAEGRDIKEGEQEYSRECRSQLDEDSRGGGEQYVGEMQALERAATLKSLQQHQHAVGVYSESYTRD